jgi:hypothetical protein
MRSEVYKRKVNTREELLAQYIATHIRAPWELRIDDEFRHFNTLSIAQT